MDRIFGVACCIGVLQQPARQQQALSAGSSSAPPAWISADAVATPVAVDINSSYQLENCCSRKDRNTLIFGHAVNGQAPAQLLMHTCASHVAGSIQLHISCWCA
jgi:hypothetical protein